MKTVIITGASGGIGSSTARLFAKKGYNIVAHFYKDEASAQSLTEDVKAGGGSIINAYADLRSFEQARELVKTAQKVFGSVDVLVNNAGISHQSLFCDINDSDYNLIMDTNLKTAFNMSKAVLPEMIRRKSGSIVNISSMWGISGGSCEVHYSAAKAGIIGMTKALAKEVGLSGITVNCVAPGVIDTKMNAHLSEEDKKALMDETPLNKIGTPEDVAKAIYFLATADFITGQTLAVDGGITL